MRGDSLVPARVDVADVVETTLVGYSGSVRVAILVKGDFLLGTDLSAGRVEAVGAEGGIRTAGVL